MAQKKSMTPEQLKISRESLQLTQEGMGEALGKSERFITYRESGVQPIDRMTKYAVCWLLLPKRVKEKYLPRFLR